MDTVSQTIAAIGLVPVIKLDRPAQDAAPLAQALCAGGVPVAEVTFRADGADTAIRQMRRACPQMVVGAGTVLTTAQLDIAIAAGAQFAVTPGFDDELVAYAQHRGLPLYPGCSTPTDYHAALKRGLRLVKFFPAEQSGGPDMIRALAAPFPQLRVLPTGGISLQNLGRYMACPAVAACGGSYMVTQQLLAGQCWSQITALCRQSIEIIQEVRSHG